jgi:hypothetical protein
MSAASDRLVPMAAWPIRVWPWRGHDPLSHHTNTDAISRRSEQLMSPGSQLPKALSGPQPRHPTHMAAMAPIGSADPETTPR